MNPSSLPLPAIGDAAFDPALTPHVLLEVAAGLSADMTEASEAMDGYAFDLATIRNLPEVKA